MRSIDSILSQTRWYRSLMLWHNVILHYLSDRLILVLANAKCFCKNVGASFLSSGFHNVLLQFLLFYLLLLLHNAGPCMLGRLTVYWSNILNKVLPPRLTSLNSTERFVNHKLIHKWFLTKTSSLRRLL